MKCLKNTTSWLSLFFLLCCGLDAKAQFFLNGEATQVNDSCYQLTTATNFSVGSVWNGDKINLNQSFDVVMQVFLGCKDSDGADGIVFGFQPVSTSIGSAGEGIGFQNIVPSLGIEMDTWQNGNLNDPAFDHIAIIRNGNLNHSAADNLAGPVQISQATTNVEDCQPHDLRVSWNANTKILEVYFDCQLRLTYEGDIVNEIFNGDPEVFWGFTSATGGANNVHEICFQYTTFLDAIDDAVVCPGGELQLRARGGNRYLWEPGTGLSDSTIANPIVSPTETTEYLLTVFDECDRPFYDTVTIAVEGDSVFFELGPDTTVCENSGFTLSAATPNSLYQWSDGSTDSILRVPEPGFYAVTVTRTDIYCEADDRIRVGFDDAPEVNLGRDTILCEGEKLILTADSLADASYLWQDFSYKPTFVAYQTGFYEVVVVNKCGFATDFVYVQVQDCEEIFIPNAFSPNGDMENDIFYLMDGGDVEEVQFLRIYNRWGNLVFQQNNFQPNNPKLGWDGTFRGNEVQPGVYLYQASVSFINGTTKTLSGDVTVLR